LRESESSFRAVRSEDFTSVGEFFEIFPLLGLHLEELNEFCSYLCVRLRETAWKNLEITSNDKEAVIFTDAMILLFFLRNRAYRTDRLIIETCYMV